MILNVIDKIIFGSLLVLVFQVPVISDHYLQFTSGYFQSIQSQVNGYKQNAQLHEYSDVYAMINHFLESDISAVRYDGTQKLHTMQEYEDLEKALVVLQTGNVFQRAWYIFNPVRREVLVKVMDNFSPSIPLVIMDIVYSALTALLLSILTMWPIKFFMRKAI